ncbi:MAG: hypothetical protein Q8942_06620 [Bacillota bacterium]|nr:hypothetical protein [Bacillota bacterium]
MICRDRNLRLEIMRLRYNNYEGLITSTEQTMNNNLIYEKSSNFDAKNSNLKELDDICKKISIA